MTSDNFENGEDNLKKSDSELGNLPPLSDFDSGVGFDSNLPPLSSFDAPQDKEKKNEDEPISLDGLPPISEISIETPQPTGGNIKPPPPGFDEYQLPAFDTPTTDTPDTSKEPTGFQDLAADSDFSPETPEIGPGPDSDMDTPMFDSAFGGGNAGFTPTFDTPAPTQAMETPIFGEQKPASPAKESEGIPAFDDGAFQSSGFEPMGTPMPDFSPDSTIAQPAAAATPEAKPKKAKKPGVSMGGAKGTLVTVGVGILLLIIGLFVGPMLSTKLTFIPNPLTKVVQDKDTEIGSLKSTIDRLATPDPAGAGLSLEQVEQLLSQKEQLTKEIAGLTGQEEDLQAQIVDTNQKLDDVTGLLDDKNEEFAKAQEAFEDLQNQTAIVQAQQQGLVAEVERLTDMVGELDLANQRRQATKEALKHSAERLLVELKEGIPLTPEEFARATRIQKVEDLQRKVDEAKWVTPEILNDYTDLYTQELQIAASSSYFFAKLPLTNSLGQREMKWAECLMRGNWSVYYRSIDGKNVGMYRNTAGPNQVPEYQFVENLPGPVQKQIADEVVASRTKDFEEKLKVVAQKQQIIDGTESKLQRIFQSL